MAKVQGNMIRPNELCVILLRDEFMEFSYESVTLFFILLSRLKVLPQEEILLCSERWGSQGEAHPVSRGLFT